MSIENNLSTLENNFNSINQQEKDIDKKIDEAFSNSNNSISDTDTFTKYIETNEIIILSSKINAGAMLNNITNELIGSNLYNDRKGENFINEEDIKKENQQNIYKQYFTEIFNNTNYNPNTKIYLDQNVSTKTKTLLTDFLNYYTKKNNINRQDFLNPNSTQKPYLNMQIYNQLSSFAYKKDVDGNYIPKDNFTSMENFIDNFIIANTKTITNEEIKNLIGNNLFPENTKNITDKMNNILAQGRLENLYGNTKIQLDKINLEIEKIYNQISHTNTQNKQYRIDKYNILKTQRTNLNNEYYSIKNNTDYPIDKNFNQNTKTKAEQRNRTFNAELFYEPITIKEGGKCIIDLNNIKNEKDYTKAINFIINDLGKNISILKIEGNKEISSNTFTDILNNIQNQMKKLQTINMENIQINTTDYLLDLPELKKNIRIIPPQIKGIKIPTDYSYKTYKEIDIIKGSVKYKERKNRISNYLTSISNNNINQINNYEKGQGELGFSDIFGNLKINPDTDLISYQIGKYKYTLNINELSEKKFNKIIKSIEKVEKHPPKKRHKGQKYGFGTIETPSMKIKKSLNLIRNLYISFGINYKKPHIKGIGPKTRTGKLLKTIFK